MPDLAKGVFAMKSFKPVAAILPLVLLMCAIQVPGVGFAQEAGEIVGVGLAPGHALLAVQATGDRSEAAFADTVSQDSIWPSESENAFYYMSGSRSGTVLCKYSLDSMSSSEAVTLSRFNTGYYLHNKYYYATQATYNSGTSSYQIRCYDFGQGTDSQLFTVTGSSAYRIGVDETGNVFIAQNGGIYVYSSTGVLLASNTDSIGSDGFYGFDSTNGNFYFRATTNWRYWGYDHLMDCLKVGNFDGQSVTYNDKSVTILNQRGYRVHYGYAQMFDGRYLFELSPFNGNELYVLDSHAISVGDVTETSTTIQLTGGFSVTDVALPADKVVFGTKARSADYGDGYTDAASVGVCAAFDSATNRAFVVTDVQTITAYGLDDGAPVGTIQASHSVYNLMKVQDSLVALEKDDEGGFFVERIPFLFPTQMALEGPASLTVGEHAALTLTIDGTVNTPTTFESSDSSILSVDRYGNVSAWKAGKATITVKSATTGLSAKKDVTVHAGQAPTSTGITDLVGGAEENNWNWNDYMTYGTKETSYLVETSQGLMRVQARSSDVLVEYYNESGTLLSTKSVAMPLPIFGGFFAGADGYYVVYGQQNADESDELVVMKVVRYSSSWSVVGTCDFKAINTYWPFDAGSLRMDELDGKLYIHTCHEMYDEGDGYHHQANMSFIIDEATMTALDSYTGVMNQSEGYVSHSFNQFVKVDGQRLYRIDHGDMYPRGISFTATAIGAKLSKPSAYATVATFASSGSSNYTGASLGGFELSATGAIIAWNEDAFTASRYYVPRDVLLTAVDLYNDGRVTSKAITHYTESDNLRCRTPHLVKIDDYHFLVMWSELNTDTNVTTTKFVQVDNQGQPVSDVIEKPVPLSDCQPIVLRSGAVAWFVSTYTDTKLYVIDPYDLKSIETEAMGADFGQKISVNDCEIILSESEFVYDGSKKEPAVTVKYAGKTLVKDVDYTVSYTNNENVGSAYASISGTGKCTGYATRRFVIKSQDSQGSGNGSGGQPGGDMDGGANGGAGGNASGGANGGAGGDVGGGSASGSGSGNGGGSANGGSANGGGSPDAGNPTSYLNSFSGKAAAAGFTDLKMSDWYMKVPDGAFPDSNTLYLDFTIGRGLMSGYTGTTRFGPDDGLNRGMAATIIYRMATGMTAETTDNGVNTKFSDVPSGQWYTAAVAWCSERGVVTGYSGTGKFGPNDPVTREQLCAMIGRYCMKQRGMDSAGDDVSRFKDGAKVSSWAREGVAFCAAKGIVSGIGTSGNFSPQGDATRCQMSKIIAVTAYMLG